MDSANAGARVGDPIAENFRAAPQRTALDQGLRLSAPCT